MEESTDAFLDFCRAAGYANAVLAAPKLVADGVMALPADAPRIAALNDVFDASTFAPTLDLAARSSAQSLYLLTGRRKHDEWTAAAVQFTREIEPFKSRNIPFFIENAPALYADIHFAHTLADTIHLAEMADIGVCVELFTCWAEADLKELFRRAGKRLGLVQVSDYVLGDRAYPCRAVPGDGLIPLERLITDVLDAGYEGVFDIELTGPRISKEGPRQAAIRAGDYMSELLLRLGA